MAIDPVLQELADRAAIRDVMILYARGLDRRDFDLVRSCFTDDAYADY
ncbi:MAG: nuclear transport factor 2 family protein, partial [Dehalococcoidia bacterium]|nr:nuclear transport factor 2 family protein [Dehalococcoidia bacterium]